jgi:hypothetical protein|tara:strand:- start:83 stop:307 length:225 start_codon:yes stop_codon:yes gene_type:complete
MKHIEIEIPHEEGIDHVEIWLSDFRLLGWEHWREDDDALYDVNVTCKDTKSLSDGMIQMMCDMKRDKEENEVQV